MPLANNCRLLPKNLESIVLLEHYFYFYLGGFVTKHSESLTVVIPCYNESRVIEKTFHETLKVLDANFAAYEIILINDSSRDKTPEIIDRLAKEHSSVTRALHNPRNLGLGGTLRHGFRESSSDRTVWISADGAMLESNWAKIFAEIGKADIVTTYIINLLDAKSNYFRVILSRAYVLLLRMITGINLRYFNGPTVYPTHLVRDLDVKSLGMGFNSEILVKMIQNGMTVKQVGILCRKEEDSKAITIKNLLSIMPTIREIMTFKKSKSVAHETQTSV